MILSKVRQIIVYAYKNRINFCVMQHFVTFILTFVETIITS